MQTQQLCQRNFESIWTRDLCETFKMCATLFYTHTCWSRHQVTLHVQMSTDAISKSEQQAEKQAPEMC